MQALPLDLGGEGIQAFGVGCDATGQTDRNPGVGVFGDEVVLVPREVANCTSK
jgi:hypothetical protein